MKTAEQCLKGLGEYRREVIGRRQEEVCRITNKEQGYMSQLECGSTMPPKWNRERLIQGYHKLGVEPITDEQFVMLIEERLRKKREKALKTPIEKDSLFATATAVKPAEVTRLVESLTCSTERKRARA